MADPNRDIDALIVRTREAHEVLKDLKQTLKEVKAVIEIAEEVEVRTIAACHKVINDGIENAVTAGLDNYHAAIDQSITSATDAVYRRFDMIASILLGEPDEEGNIPLQEAAEMFAKKRTGRPLTTMEEFFMDNTKAALRSRMED